LLCWLAKWLAEMILAGDTHIRQQLYAPHTAATADY